MAFIKLKQILQCAANKMEGVPEPILDEVCSKKGFDKDFLMDYLHKLYGVKVLTYKETLEYEFAKMEKQPKKKFVRNTVKRYPYYAFFTKDKFFLPMARKIWMGHDMSGDTHWERFTQQFNEAMRNGFVPFKSPPSGPRSGVTWERGEVEWESDDLLMLVAAEMRHFRDNPYIENTEITMWEHYRDEFVEQEMVNRGYVQLEPEFEKEDTRCGHLIGNPCEYQCCSRCTEVCNSRCSKSIEEGGCDY